MKIKLTPEQIKVIEPLADELDAENTLMKLTKADYIRAQKKLWREIYKLIPELEYKACTLDKLYWEITELDNSGEEN